MPPTKIRRLYYDELTETWILLAPDEPFPEGLPYSYKQTMIDLIYPVGGSGARGVGSDIWQVSIPRFPSGWVTSLSGGQSPEADVLIFLPDTLIYVEARDLYGSTWSEWARIIVPFTGYTY